MGKLFKRDSEKPAERKPADIQGKVNTNPKTGAILSGEQKQRIVKQKLKEKIVISFYLQLALVVVDQKQVKLMM